MVLRYLKAFGNKETSSHKEISLEILISLPSFGKCLPMNREENCGSGSGRLFGDTEMIESGHGIHIRLINQFAKT